MTAQGYRVIAPDLRGFGDTTRAPPGTVAYTNIHVVGDLVALLDDISPDQDKVFVVGHDWGAMITWALCLYKPDKVNALVNVSRSEQISGGLFQY
ncbi:hypothetical protein ACSBR1_027883 [Camellia fascicularis]